MNCGGLTSVARIFAKLSVSDVEMARRNLREQVMNKVIGIVAREKEQADQGRRKDIARAFKFIICTHEPCMVQTIGPKVQRWIDVKQGEDELNAVANALNTRPRKTLGLQTPAEALDRLLKTDMIEGVATTG